MIRRSFRRRSYFLAVLVLMLAMAVPVILLLGWILFKAIAVQSLAAEHANRVAVFDSLTHTLRRDALACRQYARGEAGVTLEIYGPAGRREVTYHVERDVVRRSAPAGDVREWRVRRLEYDWDIESGPTGDLLRLRFVEQPPPQITDVLPKTYVASILLPPQTVSPTSMEAGS